MKKIILSLLFFVSFSLFSQAQEAVITNNKSINNMKIINFYGVDFSKAKIFGAAETPAELKTGISNISKLFVTEANKYDFEKYLNLQVRYYFIQSADENNNRIDENNLISNTRIHEVTDEDIKETLASINIDKPMGAGLVIIGVMMNKPGRQGTFHWVFFDEETRDIIYRKEVSDKPGGFGVRNYWAGVLMSSLKKWKY